MSETRYKLKMELWLNLFTILQDISLSLYCFMWTRKQRAILHTRDVKLLRLLIITIIMNCCKICPNCVYFVATYLKGIMAKVVRFISEIVNFSHFRLAKCSIIYLQ